MPDLPHAVWLHVAQYLPALQLRDLLTVNRSFFEIAMDCRYRQLIFAYMDLRMVKNLVRLRDPAVARRVQVLHIYPAFLPAPVPDVVSPTLQLKDSTAADPIISKKSIIVLLHDLLSSLFENRTALYTYRHPKYRMMESLQKPEDVIQIMSDVLAGLPNLIDYQVTWHGIPPITGHSPAPLVASPLRPNLRKLSLDLSLENIQSLLSPDTCAPRLEELRLCVHSESVRDIPTRSHILENYLAPAISRFSSTLKTLVISSWDPTDLSPLFAATTSHLAVLDDLCINVPVEPTHLGDPMALNGFLQRHQSSLRCLRLRATQYGGKGYTPNLTSLHDWISAATASVALPHLRVLDVSSALFPLDTAALLVRRFAQSVSSLSATGVYVPYDRFAEMLGMLGEADSPGLVKLRIGPVSLSPQVVDLLASRIPGLTHLELLVREISPVSPEEGSLALGQRCGRSYSKSQQIDAFISEMEARRYPNWGLRHLSIVTDVLPERTYYGGLLERAFLDSVPSLRYCFI